MTLLEIECEIAKTNAELQNVHGEPCEVYARIVGYYRNVRRWNIGKKEEFEHRKMFEVSNQDCSRIILDSPLSLTRSICMSLKFRKWKADICNKETLAEMSIEFYTIDNEKPEEKLIEVLSDKVGYSDITEIEDDEF